ncbi:MAG: ABC transporter substrate-binding protein [Clostridia bacterium]|nr:ABC transporter substrate-binding protein [Clostridia bacterium]
MKTTFFKVVALLACLCMVIGVFAGCSNADNGDKNDGAAAGNEIVIGLSGPLTGDAAVYGTAVKNSAQMAVDEINAKSESGITLKLVALDDEHDASKVKGNYASLMSQGMQVSLGCVTTKPGLAFASLSKNDNVFFLTPSASGDDIVKYDNAYQMCFADANQGSVAASYVNSLNLSKIGVFYKSDDEYSKGIYNNFKKVINSDIEIVETSFLGDDKEFTQQISMLKDCSFIFMPIYYTPASIFMMQAKGNIADDAIYYGCDGFDGIASMGEDFDISAIPQEVSMLSHFNSSATEGNAKTFIDKYTEKFGKDTLNQFGASAYDCVYAIYNAINAAIKAGKTVNSSTSASDLCEILKEQFNGDFALTGGVTGENIKWNKEGASRPGFVDKEASAVIIKKAS